MKTISLCMITGNCEEYIERCLESFAPIADEICLVRAIGNAEPDRTLQIASQFFSFNQIRTAEYVNGSHAKDWPHVDSFAAARNLSFDLATSDWCFWCDTDDVLEPGGAEIIKELAQRDGYAAVLLPYRIFGRGLNLMRARLIQRGTGRWHHRVHEDFKFHVEQIQGVEDYRAVVTHQPGLSKRDSIGRNLRILESIPPEEMTTGLLYHLHVELLMAARVEESIEVAKKVLAAPDLGKPEKYEVFLNFSNSTRDNPAARAGFLHQAYATDPRRREALGLLAVNSLNANRAQDGLAYARQMMATEGPENIEWNNREAIYGWVGADIYAQALRANGFTAEAEALRVKTLKDAGGARITLVHATRGRPEKAAMARKLWLDFAEKPDQIEHVFVFDEDDKESLPLSRMHHVRVKPGGGCVAAWNVGALTTQGDVIVQLSDDWLPCPQWDKLILERIGDVRKPAVLAVSDGHRTDKLLCMAICTRAYFWIDWFLFHPWFTGVYSDNWFTELAYERNAVIEAKDIVFDHQHPVWTKREGDWDETYARQNVPERYKEGEAVITELKRRADWSTVPGWFNYWWYYHGVARRMQDGDTAAEVGVWQGRSIIYLAQELKRIGKTKCKLYAVDHFKGEKDQPEHLPTVLANGGSIKSLFMDHIQRCGVSDMIEVLEGDSAEMAGHVADGSLAHCFIDAAHDYDSARKDIEAWRAKVKPDGILAGHDADYPPVRKAVEDTLTNAQVFGPIWTRKESGPPISISATDDEAQAELKRRIEPLIKKAS